MAVLSHAAESEQAEARSYARPLWFVALVVAICFEGLGRKFLRSIPNTLFYFLKDIVLLAGILKWGFSRDLAEVARKAYAPFGIVLILAMIWTWLEVFNPGHFGLDLALLGFRAYWFWWLAPFVIANVISSRRDRAIASATMAVAAVLVAAYAAAQFASPPSAPINAYADTQDRAMDVAVVATTGRARVSATFSYISGFADFVIIVPSLVLALGLGAEGPVTKLLALAGAAASAAVMPMTGSRSPVVIGGVALLIVAVSADFLKTRAGRRMAFAAVLVFLAGAFAAPDAVQGVQDRFQSHDTGKRVSTELEILPFYAMNQYEYPALGQGTGMQQNMRMALQPGWRWEVESETGRILFELGSIGYLLHWIARLGLLVALVRLGRELKLRGDGATAGAAFALAFLAFHGGLAIDHVYQSLFFTGCGLVLGALNVPRAQT